MAVGCECGLIPGVKGGAGGRGRVSLLDSRHVPRPVSWAASSEPASHTEMGTVGSPVAGSGEPLPFAIYANGSCSEPGRPDSRLQTPNCRA